MPRAYWPKVASTFKVITGAVKVAFAELGLDHRAIGGRVAARDEEVAGRLVDGFDVEHDAIRRRPGRLEIFTVLK